MFKSLNKTFGSLKFNLTLNVKVKVAINTLFKFDGKIPLNSIVIVFTRNHEDGIKTIILMSTPVGVGDTT